MTSVIDHNGNKIDLLGCGCGEEPEYFSANGLAHEVRCPACGNTTDWEICGLDAVHEWNSGHTYASWRDAPIMGKRRKAV